MRILIVDDETLMRKTLQAQLQTPGGAHELATAAGIEEAIAALDSRVFDLAFVDLTLDDSGRRAGIELIARVQRDWPTTVAVAMTGHDEERLIEECLKSGASDYLVKPFDAGTLRQVMRKAPVLHRLLRKNQTLKNRAGASFLQPLALGSKSPAFQAVLATARKLRGAGNSVLIRGESGSGKEVLAQYLWSLENDESRPFIAVNCGAVTASLAESEFFGHKKGSFSGATEHRTGKFEAADGGDLFLDELATLPLEIQVKLLRVLSTGDIYPVGQDTPKKIGCRVIAATNENLEELIQAKAFREDLFFRIKQFSLTLPPLRERKEDILDLANGFLRAGSYGEKSFARSAEQLLLSYPWPGNIRELKSAVEVAAVLSEGQEIGEADLRPHLAAVTPPSAVTRAIPQEIDENTLQGNFNALVNEFERKLIGLAMDKKGSESAAAKFLGIPRSTLGDIRKRLAARKA
jgi:DNA-binding NtrC family response regulator